MLKDKKNKQIIKVLLVRENHIEYEVFLNEEHRKNGNTKFQNSVKETLNSGTLKDELEKMANGKESIQSNIIAAGYRAMKTENAFKDMLDI